MSPDPRRALVVTVVHRPQDARIAHRQLGALLGAGWRVSFAAPFAATGQDAPEGVRALELPRAVGRRRLRAVLAARRLLRREGPRHDVVLLHDPELLLAAAGLGLPHVVWDVHEDAAAALSDRAWVPGPLRRPLALAVRLVERWAERSCAALLLAERSYAARFRRPHTVVPNVPPVPAAQPPPPGDDRVVYVGRISRSRGAAELVALGQRLAGRVTVELAGPADADVEELLADADARGVVRWHGFVPNREALALLDGATAGLSLLHDEPNYRGSMPTKVVEYLAHGVPAITTPLPVAVQLVEHADAGVVVGFGDVEATEAAVLALVEDAGRRAELGSNGWHHARAELDWAVAGRAFVDVLEDVAVRRRPSRRSTG